MIKDHRPLTQHISSVIYDLLCVKSHQAELSILGAADIDLIIESLCVSQSNSLFICVFYFSLYSSAYSCTISL